MSKQYKPQKIPLPDVVYSRKSRQYQGAARGWRDVIFYVRAIDRQRDFYPDDVKAMNKLFIFGIWDPLYHSTENLPYEWAFSADDDQAEMFKHVLKNLVNPDERRRFTERILNIIEDYGHQVRIA